jgi:hypothetical protein
MIGRPCVGSTIRVDGVEFAVAIAESGVGPAEAAASPGAP